MPAELSEIVVAHGDGDVIRDADGRQAIILAALGQITVTYFRLQAGDGGPPPHLHHRHADAFYVLEGELSFILGPELERVDVGAGGLVAAPPEVVHTFTNESGAEVRFLNFHTPDSGFAAYMRAARDGTGPVEWDSVDMLDGGGRPRSEAIVRGPGEGERLVSGKRTATLKCDLPQICVSVFELEGPYEGPEVHAHEAQVDAFYVLEGELEMTVEGSREVALPETLAAVPHGVRHTFNHRGDGSVRFLNVHAPDGGFADFLRRVSG
jgi:mannose-6-phosphate isomerase-like protein (cupin superfamily)